MIIRFPTGLYRSILPTDTTSGSVTYTISGDPPKSDIQVIRLPVIEEEKSLPEAIFSEDERRPQYGELIYTIAKSGRSNPGSSIKQFEVGEILEFEDNSNTEEIILSSIPNTIEIRHDTNVLDLESAGLSEDEINLITTESEKKKQILEEQFTTQKAELNDFDVALAENQKKLNENKKAIRAVRIIYDIPENDLEFNNDVYQKLLTNKNNLESERDILISNRNSKVVEVEATYLSLARISELVR